ncbi:MAG: restriction endonuclease subunit S [Solirubrobacteraceae bacterium]
MRCVGVDGGSVDGRDDGGAASEWREVELGDLVSQELAEIRTGPFGTQLRASDYVRAGTPVINVRNLGYGSIRPAEVERVGPDVQERLSGHLLRAGDLVFGRKGAVDRHVLVTDREAGWMQGSDCIRVRLSSDSPVGPSFVSKCLMTPSHKAWMEAQCSHGATMASLNQAILGRIVLPVPPSATQHRIARVLSAFDELIEINERRIELLADVTRSLYREWFVRYRFPGHVDVESVDSELGLIPERWEVRTVGDVLDVIGGGTPSKKRSEYWLDGHIPWFTPTDLTRSRRRFVDESEHPITALGLASSSARLFPPGSVLMTSRATLGVLAIASKEATCNQGFIVIPPVDGVPPAFIYEWLASQSAELEQIATGATFKEITKGAFKRFPLIWPPRELLAKFRDAVSPWLQRIEECEWHNRELAATRDLVLPRLVTGILDISDIELGDLSPAEPA